MNKVKPLYRGYSHQAMFFVSIGACAMLLAKATSSIQIVSILIYSFGLLSMFGVSALYHRIHWEPKPRALMNKFDHSAIYIMIAGSCTPICLLVLGDDSGFKLLTTIWLIALIGVGQSVFFPNLPKYIRSLIYMIPGYMVLPYVSELIPKLGSTNITLLFVGGVFYTIGAIAYGTRWPVLKPLRYGYHEVFHLFVCFGAIAHFVLIYSLIG